MKSIKTEESESLEQTTRKETSPTSPNTKHIREGLTITPGLPHTESILRSLTVTPGLAGLGAVTEAFKPPTGLAGLGAVAEAFKPPTGLAGLGAVAEAFKPSSKLYDTNRILELVNVPSLLPDPGGIQESLEISSELPNVATDHPSPIRITYLSDPNTIVRPAPEIRLQLVSAPILEAAETSELDVSFDPVHWQMFSEFEICLRRTVQQVLAEVVGPNWMRQRVPHDIREKWQNRQAEDRACGRAVSDAIQYADFMDLYSIITRGDNWREAFQATFLNREDISVSFRRLNPVRRALAHSRPLTPLDIVTLIGEVSRILGRLGVRALR